MPSPASCVWVVKPPPVSRIQLSALSAPPATSTAVVSARQLLGGEGGGKGGGGEGEGGGGVGGGGLGEGGGGEGLGGGGEGGSGGGEGIAGAVPGA